MKGSMSAGISFMGALAVAQSFAFGHLCHAQNIFPGSHILVPGVRTIHDRNGRATDEHTANYVVLNRDPKIAELAQFSRTWVTR